MTHDDYLDALELLGLTPYSKATMAKLGLKKRQLGRLAAGETLPSAMLDRLIEALIALKAR